MRFSSYSCRIWEEEYLGSSFSAVHNSNFEEISNLCHQRSFSLVVTLLSDFLHEVDSATQDF